MSRSLICAGLLAAAAFFGLAAVDGGARLIPGAWAGEDSGQAKPRHHGRRHARKGQVRGYAARERAATPDEIARYFHLYGGYIDPTINKQTQAGPFDSGFFFDSGIAPNGGDSPYMN
jgi:hypothetical protein